MRIFHSFLLIAAYAVTIHSRVLESRQSTNVTTWVTSQEPIARSSLFRNIGKKGEFALSVDAGAVIASPSTSSPD